MGNKVVVEAKSLSKKFNDRVIVGGLSFEVHQGECFGILGPNGAGKSTTLRMMYGAASIEHGELFILGLNSKSNGREIRARIGVVPQEDGLENEMSVRENLLVFSAYQGVISDVGFRRTEDLLKLMRLEEYGDDFVHELSGGLKRRLAIARGMINHPDLLILDEPTTGLDPQARIWIWNFLRQVKSEMGTIIMTTHYMEEAEQICDRIAIMDKGKVLAIGNPKNLIAEHIGTQVVEVSIPKLDLHYYASRLTSKHFKYQIIEENINVHLSEHENANDVLALVQGMRVTVRNPTLQDVFIKLAGHDLRDEPV